MLAYAPNAAVRKAGLRVGYRRGRHRAARPLQQARAAARSTGGSAYPVARYDGLSQVQRANLLSIARDTWKFYTWASAWTGRRTIRAFG